MTQQAASLQRPGPSWFRAWIIFLGLVSGAGMIGVIALALWATTQRPEPLPDIPLPSVEHDGIYPAATQELTKPITISTANRHHTDFRNAVVTDIERSGGRVTSYDLIKIHAVAPASYVEQINALRDRTDGTEYRNTKYTAWAEQVAERENKGPYTKATGEWTAFTVNINARMMPTRATANAIVLAFAAALIPIIALMISLGIRGDM